MTDDDKMRKDEEKAGYVRKEWLADYFKVSQRQIQKWRSEGALVTESTQWGQRYHAFKSFGALAKHLLSKQDAQSEKMRAQIAEADIKERKAELLKIELRKRKGEVHEARHVEECMNTMILDTKATLLAIASRIVSDLIICKTESEMEAVLNTALHESLLEMTAHKYDPDTFRAMVEEDGDMNADLTEEEDDE